MAVFGTSKITGRAVPLDFRRFWILSYLHCVLEKNKKLSCEISTETLSSTADQRRKDICCSEFLLIAARRAPHNRLFRYALFSRATSRCTKRVSRVSYIFNNESKVIYKMHFNDH